MLYCYINSEHSVLGVTVKRPRDCNNCIISNLGNSIVYNESDWFMDYDDAILFGVTEFKPEGSVIYSLRIRYSGKITYLFFNKFEEVSEYVYANLGYLWRHDHFTWTNDNLRRVVSNLSSTGEHFVTFMDSDKEMTITLETHNV